MRAVRFAGVGRPAQIEDVPRPSPGPGQILVKIGGAGVCHSDLHVMEEDLGFKPPLLSDVKTQVGSASLEGASPVSRKAMPWPCMIRGAAVTAMPASSPWKTTVRTGLRSIGLDRTQIAQGDQLACGGNQHIFRHPAINNSRELFERSGTFTQRPNCSSGDPRRC